MLVKTYARFVLSITESECVLGLLPLFQYEAMTYILKLIMKKKSVIAI